MKRAFLVTQREYLENVRTKGFWIGIMITGLVVANVYETVVTNLVALRSPEVNAIATSLSLQRAIAVYVVVDDVMIPATAQIDPKGASADPAVLDGDIGDLGQENYGIVFE